MGKKDYPRTANSHDSHPTDKWLADIFISWFDPCPLNSYWDPRTDIDGLEIDWQYHTFVNPPYSNPLPWVKKAIREKAKGNTVVMLLKHDSSTKWYRLLHENGANFLMVNGRLSYGRDKPAAFPSVLAVLSGDRPPIEKEVERYE